MVATWIGGLLLGLLELAFFSSSAFGASTTFTNRAAFLGAVVSPTTFDFEVASGFPEAPASLTSLAGGEVLLSTDEDVTAATLHDFGFGFGQAIAGRSRGRVDAFKALRMTFTAPTFAVGFDDLDLTGSGGVPTEIAIINVSFLNGAPSEQFSVTDGDGDFGTAAFFGIISSDPIDSIQVFSADAITDPPGGRANLIDNVILAQVRPLLTVTRSGSGSGSVTSDPAGIDCGIDCTELYPVNTAVDLNAAAEPGSQFLGFGGDCDANGGVVMTGLRSCTATFAQVDGDPFLTVTKLGRGTGRVTSADGGIDCGADCEQLYPVTTPVDLGAVADPGSQFVGFGGDCDANGVVVMTGSRSCTATFVQVQAAPLTVTKLGSGTGRVTSTPPGIDCGTDCTELYPVNTAVDLDAVADPGSQFVAFGGDCDANGGVVMTGSRSCTATFVRVFQLTVRIIGSGQVSVPPGIACPADCSELFEVNTLVTLQAFPAPGSAVLAFGGHPDCADGIVRLTGNLECEVQFGPPPPAPLVLTGTVSVGSDGRRSNGPSFNPDVSADGTLVVFQSRATNLDGRCMNDFDQIFVRNRATGETRCLSVGLDGAPGNEASTLPAVSADGAFAAFQSGATNLAPPCTNGMVHVFLVHVETGAVTCVSTGPGGPGTGPSTAAAISADGGFVAFQTSATNLLPACATGNDQVLRWTRATGEFHCASQAASGDPGNGPSGAPAISGDGGVVAFESSATNLVVPCTTGESQIFVADLALRGIICESLSPGGDAGDDPSAAPALSADGLRLAFHSRATNLAAPCANGFDQVFVRNRASGVTECLSVADGSPGNGPSHDADLSGNGRFVVFVSSATNLVTPASPLAVSAPLQVSGNPVAQGRLPSLNQVLMSDAVKGALMGLTNPQGQDTPAGNGSNMKPTAADDGATASETTNSNTAGDDTDAENDIHMMVPRDPPPPGQSAIVAPVNGTIFRLIPDALTRIRFTWTRVRGAARYDLVLILPSGTQAVVERDTTTTFFDLPDDPNLFGAYQVQVGGVSAGGRGPLSDPVTIRLTPGMPDEGDRPVITAPADGAVLTIGTPVTFAWTPVPGATGYGFEVSGTDLEFLNPRGCDPDAVNGAGPLGGPRGPGFGFPVTDTGFEATIPRVTPGRYQIRVIALGPGGLAGCFGNAITVVVQ
jgi:Divergent InlB B-repeat domain